MCAFVNQKISKEQELKERQNKVLLIQSPTPQPDLSSYFSISLLSLWMLRSQN